MSNSEPAVDLELIAAFIEGRLGPTERERAMALIASSDAAFDVFVDATRARADTDNRVIPIGRARRWGRPAAWRFVAPAAAAAVLLFMVLPRLGVRSERSTAVSPNALIGALGGGDLRAAAIAGQ